LPLLGKALQDKTIIIEGLESRYSRKLVDIILLGIQANQALLQLARQVSGLMLERSQALMEAK
jgi:hypothetical protein